MDGPALRFRRRHRLTQAREFRRVFEARVSKRSGPLVVYLVPNGLSEPRLGLSVGRRVGGAVQRNLIKRRLRESFRLLQHELPRLAGEAYDIVVNVRPSRVLSQAEYQRRLLEAVEAAHRVWARRSRRQA